MKKITEADLDGLDPQKTTVLVSEPGEGNVFDLTEMAQREDADGCRLVRSPVTGKWFKACPNVIMTIGPIGTKADWEKAPPSAMVPAYGE